MGGRSLQGRCKVSQAPGRNARGRSPKAFAALRHDAVPAAEPGASPRCVREPRGLGEADSFPDGRGSDVARQGPEGPEGLGEATGLWPLGGEPDPLVAVAEETPALALLEHLGIVSDVVLLLDRPELALTAKGKLDEPLLKAMCTTLRARFHFEELPAEETVQAILDAGAVALTLPVVLAPGSLESFAAFADKFPRQRLVAAPRPSRDASGPSLVEAAAYLKEYVGGLCVATSEVWPTEPRLAKHGMIAVYSPRLLSWFVFVLLCARVAIAL
eukprot:scaffold91_cov254-Pinguiococcus_pyrenoidosus.AAC.16